MADPSALDKWEQNKAAQQSNPAAPSGAQQMARQGGQDSRLGNWLTSGNIQGEGYAAGSQSWLTGANQEGTNNGWDSEFVDTFYSEWGTALQDGTARTYFDRKDATGVVTWDHQSEDGSKSYTFGDVFEGGKKTGNLYEMYDRDAANLMMTPWLLDDDTQAQTFSSDDRMERLDREIQSSKEDRNQNFELSLKALEFEGDVEKREEFFREGLQDEAIIGGAGLLGGAIGGGAAAAPVGGVAGPWGIAAAAVGGALVGGVGAALNRDSLTEQAARAYEVTSLSREEFGTGAAVATGLNQWSGFGARLIAPLSNLTQGGYDYATGTVGDGESEFYRTDKNGENKAPTWMRGVDVAATVGDSLLQFASPMGVNLYMGQMGGTILGEVGQIGLTGSTFDPRRGGFDNIFKDEDGNFDKSSAAAGIGKVGIDAVQLGMVKGLTGKVDALRQDAGEAAIFSRLPGAISSRVPFRLGGTKGLAAGEERVRAGGYSFTKGADGAIVEGSRRATLGLLAPSEQLTALSARYVGRRQAAIRGGAYTADDFYRGAMSLADGERKIQTALVNGIGEGYEEAVQAVLEPWSHEGTVDGEEVFQSAVYGAAAGVGMNLGMTLNQPSADARLYAQAFLAQSMVTGEPLTEASWKSMTPTEKRGLAGMPKVVEATADAAYRKLSREMKAEHSAGVAGMHKVADAIESQKSLALSKATSATDRSFVITQLESAPKLDENGNLEPGQIPIDAVGASALQTLRNINSHLTGLALASETVQGRLAEAEAELAQAADDTDLQARVAELTEQGALAERTLRMGSEFNKILDSQLKLITEADTPATLDAEVGTFNEMLRKAFHREDFEGVELTPEDKDALARSVSLVFTRFPADNSGSWQMLLPQASVQLTIAEADNVLEISHAVLGPISGDYDGDKIQQQAQLILDNNEFEMMRGGGNYIGAGSSVNIGTPGYESFLIDKMAEALSSDSSITLRTFAAETLITIGTAVKRRYDGVADPGHIDEVLAAFYADVHANSPKARATLMDGLAAEPTGAIAAYGRDNWTNEWLWIDQLIVSTMQDFQRAYATHRPEIGAAPSTSIVDPIKQSKSRRERKAMSRATIGQTLASLDGGDSLFRMFQHLHYTAINSNVLSAQGLEPSTLSELALFYRELAQNVTRSELDETRAKDEITGRVVVQLRALARQAIKDKPSIGGSVGEVMLLISNMQVRDINYAEDGTFTEGNNNISLAQMLLKQSVMTDRRQKSRIYDSNDALQAKHARLLRMTRTNSRDYDAGAEEAFVEVFGNQQLYTLLGDQANVFGPQLTLEQYVRMFSSLDNVSRTDTRRSLMSDSGLYHGRKQEKNLPYRFDEIDDVTAFRSVVDSILKVGTGRITIDDKTGVLSGEYADRSQQTSDNIQSAHRQVKEALRKFLEFSPRKAGETDTQVVQRLFENRPAVAAAVMEMIPNASAAAVFRIDKNGDVFAADWLYEMFAHPDSGVAEKMYYRNLLVSQWYAKGLGKRESEDDHGRAFHKLNRRMHQIMYRLSKLPDGRMLQSKFMAELYSDNSVDALIEWVNTTPGVRGEMAPLTAWVDDVSEFDMDKANGGWTQKLEGAELREALRVLRQRTTGMVEELTSELASIDIDLHTLSAIDRAERKDRGEDITLDGGDRELQLRMGEAIDFAENWYVGAGPQAQLNQIHASLRSFYEQGHTKGLNPTGYAPIGAVDAGADQLGFLLPYERVLGSLTAVNLDAVGANMSHAMKDGGRTMDDHGREIVWKKPSVSDMVALFKNPETRAMARSMLFPQVLEVDPNNNIRPQMLLGKSLTELLNGEAIKDMWEINGSLSQAGAFKYGAMLEGRARKFGGDNALQREVNDLVIARTSGRTQVLSEYDMRQMEIKAYRDVIRAAQAAGSILAQPRDPGTDALGSIRVLVKQQMQRTRLANVFGMKVEDGETVTDAMLDIFLEGQQGELADEITRLGQMETDDPANAQLYIDQAEAATRASERFAEQIAILRSDDMAGQVVEMFSVDPANPQAAAHKDEILDFIRTHMSMVGRSSASRATLTKLTQQLLDKGRNGQVSLEQAEWEELSRAVIGVYLDEAMNSTRSVGSISPWPDADHADSQKYYDTSWTYLVDNLLDGRHPLVLAAAELAKANYGVEIGEMEFIDLLGRTILDPKELGTWTSDLIGPSVTAGDRLFSAAAEPAIQMAGDGAKRMAALMAATRRTFLKPDESLLSKTRLSWIDLSLDIYDDVDVELAGATGGAVKRPLAQLNNRFAKSVTFEYIDGEGQTQVVDLLPMVGREFLQEDSVRNSGYKEIHLDRIRKAVDKAAGQAKVSPSRGFVNVEFFHPDSQPETPEQGENWYNNIYFEGTAFKLPSDTFPSLISAMWFAPNGLTQLASRRALDSVKDRKPALQQADPATATERAEDEADHLTDFAGMLRAKTRRLLENPGLELEPEFYNAIYKDMKLRHFLRGEDPATGKPVVWTAEEVIAYQQQNPGAAPPMNGARLWVPSDDVLRTLLGEQGRNGVVRPTDQNIEFDLAKIDTWRGIRPEMAAFFDNGLSGQTARLQDTRLQNTARQSQLVVRTKLDPAQQSRYDEKMEHFERLRVDIHNDRGEAQRASSEKVGFNADKNLKSLRREAGKMLEAENLEIFWTSIGIPFGPRSINDLKISEKVLRDHAALTSTDQARTGWVYAEGSKAQPRKGLLNKVALDNPERPAFRVAPGDVVLLQLDSFAGDTELARQRVDYFADRGAVVLLGATNGQADVRAEIAAYLMADKQYQSIVGSPHAFQPIERSSVYQNQRARPSNLVATRTISAKNRLMVLLTQGREVTENAAWVNNDNEFLGSVAVQPNLVPTSAFGGFGPPVEQFHTGSQIEKVRHALLALDTAEGRALLKQQSHGDQVAKKKGDKEALDRDFDIHFDRLIERLQRSEGSLLPKSGEIFGLGDMIPLINNNDQILLYRHGHKAPRRDQLEEMTSMAKQGTLDAARVAIYPSARENEATIHTGEVVRFRSRSGYGLEVELNVPLQVWGNKYQLEFNGMKYVTAPMPQSVALPDHGFFRTRGVDMVADLESAVSKEALGDAIVDHAHAFAFFGIDFLPDVTEFFFPGKATSADAQASTKEMLRMISTRVPKITVTEADELIRIGRLTPRYLQAIPAELAELAGVSMDWQNNLSSVEPASQITMAMVLYLMTPGAAIEDVLQTGGLNNETSLDSNNRSRLMPEIFTQIFDDADLGSPLRKDINERLNDQLYNPHTDGTGYRLHEDFTFEVKNSDSSTSMRGFLAFPEVHASGDNPVKSEMSYDDTATQGVSTHTGAILYGSTGAESAFGKDLSVARLYADALRGDTFEKDLKDGGAWRTLSDVPKVDQSFQYWHAELPAEAAYRNISRTEMVAYRQEIVKNEETGWTPEQVTEFNRRAKTIVTNLRLYDRQSGMVDGWVRQYYGETDRVSGLDALATLDEIEWNVENHYLPVTGGMVSRMHIHDLQAIHRANKPLGQSGWLLRSSMDPKSVPAKSWDDWVAVSLGSFTQSEDSFDSLYLRALDGFTHTYQHATRSLGDLPVSVDELRARELFDPKTNRMMVSVNEATDQQMQDPVILEYAKATIAQALGEQEQGRPAGAVRAKRLAKIRKWRRENNMPMQVDVTSKNLKKNGLEFIDDATTTNAFIRGLIHLRLGMALINPALYVAMGPEQWLRGALDRVANTITGQATVGYTSKVMAKKGWSRFSEAELSQLRDLYPVLGQRNDFKAMIYKDLGFRAEHGPGGKITRGLEAFARFGTGMQDPTYGMRADTTARRYVEAAMQHILATPTLNTVTPSAMVRGLSTNPAWLKENMPEAHVFASNAVAQIRSLKATVLGQSLKGIYEPMATSNHPGVNVMGNLLLKIPMLFSNYGMNVATSITGLQGLDQMTAMFLHGRAKGVGGNDFIGRIQAKIRGDEISKDETLTYDMSSVLEGVDLSRAFIRGGLTHAGLFAFGLWAGGLGLSGEDEEMRRRRLQAEMQGVGNIYDPRRIENDFRNADAIYLDALPFGLGNFFEADEETGRAMYQMHWMLRQFVSPVIGMEKFFQTGDLRHITWGFEDALGSFPLINTMKWQDVVETADTLAHGAGELAESDDPGAMVESGNRLTRMVGVYERMLFESSFINQLYIGYDRYDRDPYVLPLLDSDGTIQRDIEGNARRQNLALNTFFNEETGSLQQGYLTRDDAGAQIRVLSENRATLAFVSSLFSGDGAGSDFWRYNMPVKTRTFDKAGVTVSDVKDMVEVNQKTGTSGPDINQQVKAVTVEEVLPAVRNFLYKLGDQNGHFYTDDEVWAAARTKAAAVNSGPGGATALSYTDGKGNEKPTIAGAKAVFLGIYHGSVTFDSAALNGFFVSFEDRQKIADQWSKDLIQEGINIGLDRTQAGKRMERVMYGYGQPDGQGLSDIIWAPEEKLSYKDSQTFAQLNTTYTIGPDGRPIATGFERGKLMSALGLQPVTRQVRPEQGATLQDGRFNVADMQSGMNTGLRALEPVNDTRNVPTDKEIGDAIIEAIEKAQKADYTPFEKWDDDKSGSGWTNYGGYGGYGGYSSGGGGGGGGAYFQKMYTLPNSMTPYGNSMPFINTSNPIIRRSQVRRERVWSERGRLKQWQ